MLSLPEEVLPVRLNLNGLEPRSTTFGGARLDEIDYPSPEWDSLED